MFIAEAFLGASRSRMINQNLPHYARGDSKEVHIV